jgi:hypothetical protein
MSDRSFFYVITEGKRDQNFVRGLLKRSGVGPREMVFAPISEGQGSGKQRVLSQFAGQVVACRRRKSRAATSLIVMMDADDQSVDRCCGDLDRRLSEAGQERVDRRSDSIARLIPKRNIETWLFYLTSDAEARIGIDETADFKTSKPKDAWDSLLPAASDAFFTWHHAPSNRPQPLLDSLGRGLRELAAALPE